MTESARGSTSTEQATNTLTGQGQATNGLREIDPFAARRWTRLPDVPQHPVATEVAASVTAAVRLARARLATRLPGRVLEEVGSYFEAPMVDRWDDCERPAVSTIDLFGDLCAVPRSVSVRDKAAGLQLEVRTLDETLNPEALGAPVGPGSEVLMLSLPRLEAAAASNCSIELRQFDRQCPAWSSFADDLVTITGADG